MALSAHSREYGLGNDKGRGQIDVDDLAEILNRHLVHGDAFDNTGVVHKDIQSAVLLLDLCHKLLHGSFICHITDIAMCIDAILMVIFQCLLNVPFASCIKDDRRAGLGICFCNGIANSVAAACHPCDLAFQ